MTSPNRKLRTRYRSLRRQIDPQHQADHAEAATRAVLTSGLVSRLGRCGLYFSQVADGELDTLPLLSRMWAAGKTVACPVVGGRGEMDFYRVTPRTPLSLNRYGIPEPRTRGPAPAVF